MSGDTSPSAFGSHELLRHPRNKEPLRCSGSKLIGSISGDVFEIEEGPIPRYQLYIDDHPHERGRDPEQSWSQHGFDHGFERSGYYESGVEFDRALGRDPRLSRFHFKRVKEKLLDWIRPGREHLALDVGCGAGYFLCMIRDRYRRRGFELSMAGVDVSSVQLAFLAKRMEKEKLKAVIAVRANAEYLPFADETFDLVTCSEVLEHIRTPSRALEEMRRVLKPQGMLLLSTPSKLNEELWDILLAPFVRIGKALLPRPGETIIRGVDGAYDVPWYPGELRRAFYEAGLEIERFEQTGLIPHPYYFDYVPRRLMGPVMLGFEEADKRFSSHLKAFNAHLLVGATKRSAGVDRSAD